MAFFTTPIGIACAIVAAILTLRVAGELLSFAAKVAVVAAMVGVVLYFLGWRPPVGRWVREAEHSAQRRV